MTRPKKERIVKIPPLFSLFKPAGVRQKDLKFTELSLDEYEAIRLTDYLGLDHLEAAEEMEISRSTFSRLIEKARRKMAAFLIDGTALNIQGGNIHFRKNLIQCLDCGFVFNMDFSQKIESCPNCNSANLKDLAGSFGHGRCCRNRNSRNRR
jgi:predicted DNA-binding protein (UPF0251 family)